MRITLLLLVSSVAFDGATSLAVPAIGLTSTDEPVPTKPIETPGMLPLINNSDAVVAAGITPVGEPWPEMRRYLLPLVQISPLGLCFQPEPNVGCVP